MFGIQDVSLDFKHPLKDIIIVWSIKSFLLYEISYEKSVLLMWSQ